MRGFRDRPAAQPIDPLLLRITRGGSPVLTTRLSPHQPVDIYVPGIKITIEMDSQGRFVLHQTVTMT